MLGKYSISFLNIFFTYFKILFSRMIVAIVVSFIVPSGYHVALIYVSIAIMFFLVNFIPLESLA